MKTAIRSAIAAGRTLEDKERLLHGDNAAPTGAMSFVFDTGNTTIGGHGEVYDNFCKNGVLTGYPGEGTQPVTSEHANYKDATLKVMQFHETFKQLKKDVDLSK